MKHSVFHHLRPLLVIACALLIASLASCVQPPAPKTYNPAMARHLRNLSHDEPVTPMPSSHGDWGYCHSYRRYCY